MFKIAIFQPKEESQYLYTERSPMRLVKSSVFLASELLLAWTVALVFVFVPSSGPAAELR
jgi:hypothetical protein